MYKDIKLFFLGVLGLVSLCLTSCSDDELGSSIFDTTQTSLDRSLATFPLDTFLLKNYQEPYNLKFIYKLQDIGSDMNKNLTPADYEKACELAVLCKYFWFDAYKESVGETFLKTYSPRVIHVIGSANISSSSGTEVMGSSEGGLKVTLYKVNQLDYTDIDKLNEMFYETLHHEFAHILNQNFERPTDFATFSTGRYNSADWQTTPDSLVLSSGFITPYAYSQAREDWAEIIAKYITTDVDTWNGMIHSASFGWETAMVDAAKFTALVKGGSYTPDSSKPDSVIRYAANPNLDSVGYQTYNYNQYVRQGNAYITYQVVRKVIDRDSLDNPRDHKIVYEDNDGIDGRQVILDKLDMARKWLKENFNMDIDKVRMDVLRREYLTDEQGNFVRDAQGKLINKLTQPSETDPSKTLMETLLEQISQYKALQTN